MTALSPERRTVGRELANGKSTARASVRAISTSPAILALLIGCMIAVSGTSLNPANAQPPPRVYSADYCADQYALAFAPDSAIAGLSPDAHRDFSYARDKAVGLQQVRPDAESVFSLHPDVILTAWGGDAQRLTHLGLAVERLPFARSLSDIEDAIREVGAALKASGRASVIIDSMEKRRALLDARVIARHSADAQSDRERPIRALYATPGGVTAGGGTLIDELMTLAGLHNVAASRAGWPSLPVEKLIADPPDLIIAGFFETATARADNWSLAQHPALQDLFANTPTIHLPADSLACPAWFALDAAEAMADAADTLLASGDLAKPPAERATNTNRIIP